MLILIIWLISGALGAAVSVPGKKHLGFLLGLLLGPLGVLIAAIANKE